MIPPNDVVADLPAPLDDEPPSVRRDIADELADHLACAYRRELLKTADERTAQQQVLDRFGNPQRIAYQLWFQALWGRIMLNRFGRVVQGLKIVGGLLVLFFVFRMAEQQTALHNQLVMLAASNGSMQAQATGTRSLLEQLLARLPVPPQPDQSSGIGGEMSSMMMSDGGGPPGMMSDGDPTAIPGMSTMGMAGASSGSPVPQRGLKLRVTVEGKPAVGCTVSVVKENGERLTPYAHPTPSGSEGGMGSAMGMTPPGMGGGGGPSTGYPAQLHPVMNGEVHFAMMQPNGVPQILEPGRYTVQVNFPDGRQGTHRFVVPPNQKTALHEEQIECPPADQKAYVTFHVPVLDKKYVDVKLGTQVELTRKPLRIGKTDWTATNGLHRWTIYFDPATGAPISYFPHERQKQHLTKLVELSDLPPEERFLELAAGNYQVDIKWTTTDQLTLITTFPRFKPRQDLFGTMLPAAGAATDGVLSIAPDTRDVLLDFPEEAYKKLDHALSGSDATPTDESPSPPVDPATIPR